MFVRSGLMKTEQRNELSWRVYVPSSLVSSMQSWPTAQGHPWPWSWGRNHYAGASAFDGRKKVHISDWHEEG